MKHLFLSLLLLLTVCCTPAGASKSPVPSIEALRDHTGAIHCTIFSINEREHLWLTAQHCVLDHEEDGKVSTDLFINQEQATVYKLFPDMDAAILYTPRQHAPGLELTKQAPALDDVVSVLGHGWGWEGLTLFHGRVANAGVDAGGGQFFTIFDMSVFPGHSGSPVFGADHRVISIMQIRIEGGASGGCTWDNLKRETGGYWGK